MTALYLCGSSRELDRVKLWAASVYRFSERLKVPESLEITHAWWTDVETVGEANPPTAPFHSRMRWAAEDLKGIRTADVVWLLWPSTPSVGCYWECGYADALGLDVIISGPGQLGSIFSTRGRSYDTDTEGFDALCDTVWNEGVYLRELVGG